MERKDIYIGTGAFFIVIVFTLSGGITLAATTFFSSEQALNILMSETRLRVNILFDRFICDLDLL